MLDGVNETAGAGADAAAALYATATVPLPIDRFAVDHVPPTVTAPAVAGTWYTDVAQP